MLCLELVQVRNALNRLHSPATTTLRGMFIRRSKLPMECQHFLQEGKVNSRQNSGSSLLFDRPILRELCQVRRNIWGGWRAYSIPSAVSISILFALTSFGKRCSRNFSSSLSTLSCMSVSGAPDSWSPYPRSVGEARSTS